MKVIIVYRLGLIRLIIKLICILRSYVIFKKYLIKYMFIHLHLQIFNDILLKQDYFYNPFLNNFANEPLVKIL